MVTFSIIFLLVYLYFMLSLTPEMPLDSSDLRTDIEQYAHLF